MSDLCKRGHELAGDNLLIQHGRRVCRTCDRARKRDWQARKRAADKGLRGDDRRLCRECRIKAGWTVEW